MKAKKIISLLMAAVMLLSIPVAAACAAAEPVGALTPAAMEQTNEMVSIRMSVKGNLVYGSPVEVVVDTSPENTQYIGVLMGTGGEAFGIVTLALSPKIQTLLKLIPLPTVMSATPEQTEEFNLYAYLKQLIDGNDAGVLLRVADEVVSVMDVLKFYIPTLTDVANGLRTALELIRQFLPDTSGTRIYLDEQPKDSGNYIAGAVALESGDVNTAGMVMFTIKPKSEGVSMHWAEEAPAQMTVAEAAEFNAAAVLDDNGYTVSDAKITYTYRSGGWLSFLGGDGVESDTLPTEPGEYVQTAKVGGNYSCSNITRTIKIVK